MHERIPLGSLTPFVSGRGGPLRALGEVHLCALWQDNQMEPVERALPHRPGELKGVDADESWTIPLPYRTMSTILVTRSRQRFNSHTIASTAAV